MRESRAVVGAAMLLLIAAAYLWFALIVRGAHDFSGDEPHYLAFTQGMWLYGTIDQHRVLYHHDFLAYFPQGMTSHSVHRGGHLYPLHYPGLPLLLLPGFALARAAGAQVTTALVGMLVCWRSFHLARRVAGAVAAAIAVGVLGLSAPFVLNAGAIYPDLLSALLLILAFEAIDAPRLTARRALALGLLLAACPWVHVKLLIAVAVYAAWAAYALWRDARASPPTPWPLPLRGNPGPAVPAATMADWSPGCCGNRRPSAPGPARLSIFVKRGSPQRPPPLSRRQGEGPGLRAAPPLARAQGGWVTTTWEGGIRPLGVRAPALLALGLPLLSIVALMCYNLAFYGSPSPAAPYQGPTLFTGNPLGGVIGQIFAQSQGALGMAPFALLAIPGAVALWQRDRVLALRVALVTLPFWLITLTYRDWWGGDAPPLRYVLPVLPLWIPGIAALLESLRTAVARVTVAVLATATLALTLFVPMAQRLGWPLRDGQSALLLAIDERVRVPLTQWLPAFEPTRDGPGIWHSAPLIVLWAAILLLTWGMLAWLERRARPMKA